MKWILASKQLPTLPDGEVDKWTNPLLVFTDTGDIFNISYFVGAEGGHWQRTKAFNASGSKEVVFWMPMPEFEHQL